MKLLKNALLLIPMLMAAGVLMWFLYTITDLIWPFWVLEYKGDKEHNSLFLRGLMGSGGKYTRAASE